MSTELDTYTAAMNSLSFSDDAKARMVNKLDAARARTGENPSTGKGRAHVLEMPAAASARARRRPHRILRAAAAAAAVLAIGFGGTGIAVASGVLPNPADVLSDIFGESPAETELLGTIGHPLDATCTDAGITVTARAVVGDRTNLAVVLDIEKADGVTFEGLTANEYGCLNLGLTGDSIEVDGLRGAAGSSHFYDADPSDNTIQCVLQLSLATDGGQSIIGRVARLSMDGLIQYNEQTGTYETVANGSWNLKFKTNYVDTSVDVPLSDATVTFSAGGQSTEAAITSITVSDIGITVDYTVDGTLELTGGSGEMSDEDQAALDSFTEMPIVVTFADGSTEEISSTSSQTESIAGNKTAVTKATQFSRIVDVDDIVSVTLGDTTFPLS